MPTIIGGTKTGIKLNSSAINWLSNITIQDVTAYGGTIGLALLSEANGINIIRGKYCYASMGGMSLTEVACTDSSLYSRNILIDGTEVAFNSRQGIVTWGLKNLTLKNTWTHHNAASGIQIENFCTNVLIEDFLSENNSRFLNYETGLWIDDSKDVVVRRGIIRGNETGFRVSNSKNVLAFHLLIYNNNHSINAGENNNSSGICFYSTVLGTMNHLYDCNVTLYNSVIYNNGNAYSQRGSVDLEGSGLYIIKNNIIANDQSKLDVYRTGSHTLISNNNLIFNTRAISAYYSPTRIYVRPMTWTDYKTASKQDAQTANKYPAFIDPARGNFKLKTGSPAINNGVNIGVITTDYTNKILNGQRDIGAFEF